MLFLVVGATVGSYVWWRRPQSRLNTDEYIQVPTGSIVDPKWFIPDPDPALNFPRSGSRQKFRIHADRDPNSTYIN